MPRDTTTSNVRLENAVDLTVPRTPPTLRRRVGRAALVLAAAAGVALPLATPASAIEFESLGASVTDLSGQPSRQAGAHPDVALKFKVPPREPSNPLSAPVELPHRMLVDLPMGLVGNPAAVPTCSEASLKAGMEGAAAFCPVGSQVGFAQVFTSFDEVGRFDAPIYNIERPPGTPGLFAFNIVGAVIMLSPTVRAGEYGISIDSGAMAQGATIIGANIRLWGVPADPVHDAERYGVIIPGLMFPPASSQSPRVPFLTMPTSCPGTPEVTTAHLDGWETVGQFTTRSFSSDFDGLPFVSTGCDRLAFKPTIDVKPVSRTADAPTGLDVSIDVPQSDAPNGLATAHVRKVAVTLPAGMSVSPSSAAGLGACAPAQVGIGTNDPATCPRSAKIGSVEIVTPLLDVPLTGDVLLARQNDNPFDSLLAIYLVAEGPGFIVKLPGKVDLDAATGQLTATFDNNPQLPFSSLDVTFDGGPQAALATPPACGTHTTSTAITSWASSTPVTSESQMVIDQGCATGGFKPGFAAGVSEAFGGHSSPFSLTFSRRDGEQLLSALDTTLPPGLVGTIASVPLCPEALAAAGTCGAESKVGSTTVLSGPGSAPISIPEAGKAPTAVYLGGPYKGAPFSLSLLVPAQAGPLNLGNIVVRAALFVDSRDAHVTVKSDPIPSIVQGIPLRIRRVTVNLDRPGFMLNPTSCDAMRIGGRITSTQGAAADVASRFKVGDCAALAYAPKMTVTVGARGKLKKEQRTPLDVTLTMPRAQANNKSVQVTLPKTLNARLDVVNKRKACSIEQFNADRCPMSVGTASAITPLLRDPLRGPAYFVYNPDRRLPDLVVRLKGQVAVDLVGKVTITRDLKLQTTFDTIPDVPITTFRLRLESGPANGAIGITKDLCLPATRRGLRAGLSFTAQSNKRIVRSQTIKVAGCGRASRAGTRRAARRR